MVVVIIMVLVVLRVRAWDNGSVLCRVNKSVNMSVFFFSL